MGLTRKVLLGLGGLAVLGVASNLVAIAEFGRIEERVATLIRVAQPVSMLAHDLETATVETSAAVLRYLADPGPASRTQIDAAAAQAARRAHSLGELARDPALRDALPRFNGAFERFRSTGLRMVALRDREQRLVDASLATFATLERLLERDAPAGEVRAGSQAAMLDRLSLLRAEIVQVVGRLGARGDPGDGADRDQVVRELARARTVLTGVAAATGGNDALAAWLRDLGEELGRLAWLRLETSGARGALRAETERFATERREIGAILDDDLKPLAARSLLLVQREAGTAIGDATVRTALLALCSALLVLLFIAFVARTVVRPIRTLAAAAHRVEAGDLSTPVVLPDRAASEIRRLGDAFNAMLAEVGSSQRGLAAMNADLERSVRARTAELTVANQDLRAAAEMANRASSAKSRFLAAMTHELRTPLNAIIGFSEIVRDDLYRRGTDQRYRDYAADVVRSARHLLAIVDDLLDVAKIEAGKHDLKLETVAVAQAVDDCLRMLRGRFEENGIAVASELDPAAGTIFADARLVRQILLNLLSNATKFTLPGGRITITAKPDGEFVALTVADTGIGMTAEEVTQATNAFYQADSGLARRFGGAGLGLTLVLDFVERHGGTLAIESTPNRGTAVTVRLPVGRPRGAAAPALPPPIDAE